MSDSRPTPVDSLVLAHEVDTLCDRYEAALRRGDAATLEAWLPAGGPTRVAALPELVRLDMEHRLKAGQAARAEDYFARFPELAADPSAAARLFAAERQMRRASGPAAPPGASPESPADSWAGDTAPEAPHPRTPGAALSSLSMDQTAPPNGSARAMPADAAATVHLPGYEVLEVLGRGGMGVVYKARHLALKRVVALKMILTGRHAEEHERGRFRAEAEAMARLQHPNIIQVYEIGEYEGRPFFSLEFCPGGGLDRKLNGTPLPPKEAARLVETLARAVHVAHQQKVIHRDLKPANVLLMEDGTPKVTDFGLAKRLDEAGQTQSGAVIGTPSYMAPEQAGGRAKEVGPAADVYALGAVLYECLTGRPPFKAPTALETVRQVLSDDPAPPRRLQSRTPRDLETVCLKCLAKQPGRRYADAEALADDLRRFQAGEPVLARPVGPLERGWKWARSHAVLVSVVSAAALAVLAVAATAFVLIAQSRDDALRSRDAAAALAAEKARLADANGVLADKERAGRQDLQSALGRAEDEAAKADEVSNFLIGTFQASDPLGIDELSPFLIPKATGEALTAQAVLVRGETKCRTDLVDRPAVQAKVLDSIGAVYLAQGNFKEAGRLLEDARAVRERAPGVSPLDAAAGDFHLGRLAHYLGQYDKAEALYRKALEVRRERLGPGDPLVADTLFNLAWLLSEKDEWAESEKLFGEVIELRRRLPGGDERRDVAVAKFGLAACYLDQDDRRNDVEAAGLGYEAVQTFVRLEGDQNLGKAVGLFQRALLLRELNYSLAESQLRECLALAQGSLGPRNVYVAAVLFSLAEVLEDEGKNDEAEKDYLECLDIVRTQVGLAHPKATLVVSRVADVLSRRGKREQAEKLYQELLDARKDRFGEDHFFTADVLTAYGHFLAGKDEARCEQALRRALTIYRSSGGLRRRYFIAALTGLGDLLLRTNRFKEAEAAYRELLPLVRERFGEASDRTAYVESGVGAAVVRQGRTDAEAEQLLLSAVKTYENLPGAKPIDLTDALGDLGRYYRAAGRPADAAAAALRRRQDRPDDPEQLFAAACDLALCVPLAKDDAAAREKYADEAAATLKQAVDKGFRDAAKLKQAAALAPLRGRADYQELEKHLMGASAP